MPVLKLNNISILLVISLFWNLISCLVIGKAEPYKDDVHQETLRMREMLKDDLESRRRIDQYPSQSFHSGAIQSTSASPEYDDEVTAFYIDVKWNEWDHVNEKAKPYDWNEVTYPQWNKFTFPDIDWNRFTGMDKITLKPFDYDVSFRSKPSRAAIYIPIIIICALITLCKYTICKGRNTRVLSETTVPSMIIITARTRNQTTPEEETPASSVSGPTQAATGHPASSSSETDKPPDYSTVVKSDFAKEPGIFAYTVPDSPPPKYEEGNSK